MTTHVLFYGGEGHWVCRPGFGRFLETVSPLFDAITLCVPVCSEAPPPSFRPMRLRNLRVCPLPRYYRKHEQAALIHFRELAACLREPIRQSDFAWILLPNYLSLVAWRVCLKAQKPYALRVVGNWPETVELTFQRKRLPRLGRRLASLHQWTLRRMVRRASAVLTAGEDLAKGLDNGEPKFFPFVSSTYGLSDISDAIAKSDTDRCRIITVGRIDSYKGHRELILAAKALLDEGLGLELRIVGDGPQRNDFEEMARKLGIAEQVQFRGWVELGEPLKREYRTSDVLVLASYSEGSPKVVTEGMANGLPTVATRVGAVPMVVRDGESGWIVPPRDVGALRDALRKLIVDPELRRRMARNGLKRAEEFCVEAERQRVETAFRQTGLL